MANGNNGFTPTERKMMEKLGDGFMHHIKELHGCLVDDLGSLDNVHGHISKIRKKLRPHGQDVMTRFENGETYYMLVRLMHSTGRTP